MDKTCRVLEQSRCSSIVFCLNKDPIFIPKFIETSLIKFGSGLPLVANHIIGGTR